MDGGATATEHLRGMIDDSGGTRVAGPPSCCPARGAESTGQRNRRRTPPASETNGSLSAQEAGGRSVLTSPSTRALWRARFRSLPPSEKSSRRRRALPRGPLSAISGVRACRLATRRGRRRRRPEEEPDHLSARVRPPGIGVGTDRVSAIPGMPPAVHRPGLDEDRPVAIGVHRLRARMTAPPPLPASSPTPRFRPRPAGQPPAFRRSPGPRPGPGRRGRRSTGSDPRGRASPRSAWRPTGAR